MTTTILLVDDQTFITDVLADELTDRGYVVAVADSAAAAIVALDAQPIDALVTDINMGAGADGWAVARHARVGHPDLPVVYTTGGAAHEWRANGVAGSVLVPKPCGAGAIVSALTAICPEK